ncbi:hypothetical protein [Bifidobacterium canis]|uniref:Uncharacterized protein n=1 Tax=Bifidobacterium canis TaxID=2610880 RepID=A0A7K1J792_9BIFI|nr:hypothetical protein [Bifidobacterium canis]MUH60538.1 hypothetical protein [Bifidobacterium canis]
MRERSTERWLDIEGEEQPAGDKSAVKKACFVLVAMFTALVTLFVAAPANAVIGSSEVTVADTKVSFFKKTMMML